jgi:hypothetical protein
MQNFRMNRPWQGHRDYRRRLPRQNRERYPHVTIEELLANPEALEDYKPEGVIEDAKPEPEPHVESNVEPLSEEVQTSPFRRKSRNRRPAGKQA